jgi:hypothetical protein
MAELSEQGIPASQAGPAQETDLVAAVKRILDGSSEPLTLAKIRSALPANLRSVNLETLKDTLDRQVTANVLYRFPKYRSQQDRYWDKPMEVHVAHLLRSAADQRPMAWPDLRRKLPDYARTHAESLLEQEVARGTLYRHPPLTKRTGPRYGTSRPDPKEFLNSELSEVFNRLERLGFSESEIRAGALELLHEEEWAPTRRPPEAPLAGTSEPSLAATGEGPRESPLEIPPPQPPEH